MRLKVIFIISLIFIFFTVINGIVATDLSNTSLETVDFKNTGNDFISSEFNDNNILNEVNCENTGNDFISSELDDDLLLESSNTLDDSINDSDDFIEIYVGQNKTEGGNGSYYNPFSTLDGACDFANTKNKTVTIVNIFDGTYYLDKIIKFNTSNLYIRGINGSVIIKNMYDPDNNADIYMGIGLISDSSNFTMSNLIYDATEYRTGIIDSLTGFSLFDGTANFGVFENCSFLGLSSTRLYGLGFDSNFINCYFEGTSSKVIFKDNFKMNGNYYFKNCIFNLPNAPRLGNSNMYIPCNITFEDVWFGQNNIPSYMTPQKRYVRDKDNKQIDGYSIPITRYAMFSVYENYKGNNTYEIIGKLTWNGTENQDNMENFQPMTVKLTSNTGNISETVILTNGTFKAIYTSSSNENRITAVLHNQPRVLNFNSVNFTVDAPSIYYGEDQNIIVTFPQVINANITITVNNKTYDVYVNNTNSTTYTIKDMNLTEGNYPVDVVLNDTVNNVYGSSSAVLSVSKVSVDDYFDYTIPSDVVYGQNATITVKLPKDVTGNVTVSVGNDTKELPANETVSFEFAGLNATTYSVTISYSGSDKYTSIEKSESLTVNPAQSGVIIESSVFAYGEVISIPFTPINATGVNVRVLNKDDVEVANATSESNIISLDILAAGEYTLKLTTIVTSNYEETTETSTLTINKANSTLEISDQEFAYATEAIINTVTVNSTGDVIATLMDADNKEIPLTVSGDNITLPLLNVGKYTLKATTNVDENHNNATKSATITITKTIPSMEIIVEPAENITVKDDVTLTVKLPSDATGDIVIKVNGKKFDNVSANETITINLSNDAGDYIVDIIYSGDKNYESDMSTKEFTISKAKTTITANSIIFEEGNSSTIEVSIPDVESGVIFVDVGDEKFYGNINAGKATVLIKGLPAGNYTAKISFAGDKKFTEATGNTNVNVTAAPDIIGELKEIIKNQTEQITALNNTVNAQNSTIESQAKEIKNSTIESQAKEISNLTDTVNAQNSTIESQAKEINSLNETVIAQNSTINNQKEQINNLSHKKDAILVVDKTFTRAAVDTGAGEKGGMFYAILKDSDNDVLANKTVQIAINGKIYTRTTDDQGRAGIQVNFATANTYSYAISFQGDDTYNAAPMASSKLTVTKKKTTIKATNKVFKAKTKTKKISVTLKTVKNQYDKKTYLKSGKKVTLKVNGKTYTAKINKKGVAKFTIKINKKGKYTAKIKFAGDKTYKASSKTIKIRIK